MRQSVLKILMTINRAERELEGLRQTLCLMPDFYLRDAFQRLQTSRQETPHLREPCISREDIIQFLRENRVYDVDRAAVAQLITFYSSM